MVNLFHFAFKKLKFYYAPNNPQTNYDFGDWIPIEIFRTAEF